MNAAIIATLDTPAVAERLTLLGAIVVAPERRSSDYLKIFVASEIEKWSSTIKNANMQLETRD